MSYRPYRAGLGLQLSQACEFVSGRQSMRIAKRGFVTLHPSRHLASLSPPNPTWTIATRSFATSQTCLKSKRLQTPQSPQNPSASPSRFAQASSSVEEYDVPDLAEIMAAVDRITKAFTAQKGIPDERMTLAALRACAQTDVRQAADTQTSHSEVAAAEDRPVSQLLGLEGEAAKAGQPSPSHADSVLPPEDVVDKVSEAAYAIVAHPAVVITPEVLEEYVRLQARLGRPQTLPQVLGLYASKPIPKEASGSIRYVESNPEKASKAVDPTVAEAALNAAIEADNLEAAIGVVEATYSSKSYLRAKLLRKGLFPAAVAGAVPLALYLLASEFAQFQSAWDHASATKIAFAGALCYVGFTGTIGMVAAFTANDQMKRVTWAIGTPLGHRWLYEDERAALDRIACAFGFSEEHRHGEEEGEEYLWLREYLLSRSMILDAVDLMEGMN
ncbi:hypothetical protein QBC40DRAFT_49064 [Triangularia verruculosa]|uniref:Uncharacterized protein n=1 Tax=Triangularia verruculosa TaxID=2587418 RepID=A0AAN6XK70_9PEZI|nr:hypothetical protein QBC40DRAFT_49064 [Triangularia verruculosa]